MSEGSHRPDLFRHLLSNLRYGACEAELTDAIAEATRAAQDTGKKATITLTIEIKPRPHGGQYVIADTIKTKLPELPREETIMFGTPDGNLVREDPRQQKLPLRDVAAPAAATTEIRSTETAPAPVRTVG